MYVTISDMNSPTLFIIFGGTGDLARRKLLPALLDLHVRTMLPDQFRIVGFSRRDFSDDDYRSFVREVLENKGHGHPEVLVDSFLARFHYSKGDFKDVESYHALSEHLSTLEQEIGMCTNKLLYLAVPPQFYETIFDNLEASKLNLPCSSETGWSRVLVEKPFGSDLTSAQALEKKLCSVFKDEQIFRIDHYLTKEALQNILTFRFANVVFESSWDRNWIESVHIRFIEEIDASERGAFYSEVGALRDVGQNHMLQMLTLIAMDNPKQLKAAALREERAKVLNSLRIYDSDELREYVQRGQYKGFTDIEEVPDDSQTETYFNVTAFVDNDRWKEVPFILEGGKALDRRESSITITFKKPEECLCGDMPLHEYQNVVKIFAEPNQDIQLRFWAKKTGLSFDLEQRDMTFDSDEELLRNSPDAYEKILFDCIAGDQTLFVSTKEVEAAWKFITPILEGWGDLPLLEYEQGSKGPAGK